MQDLDKFKNEMNLSGKNVYVGHRYVPKIMGEWNNENIYEPLSIVQYQGASYTSRQYVPVGIEITNEDFWVVTGNYNAQVEQYRQDVRNLSEQYENKADLTALESLAETVSDDVENLNNEKDWQRTFKGHTNSDAAVTDLINTGLSYVKRNDIWYGQKGTAVSNNPGTFWDGDHYLMDCSSFVETSLRGISYENSAYKNNGVNYPEKNGFYYDPDFPRKHDRMLANEQLKYCVEKGWAFKPNSDWSNVQSGDIIFIVDPTIQDETFYEKIGHNGIIFNNDQNNNITVLEMGNARGESDGISGAGVRTYGKSFLKTRGVFIGRIPLKESQKSVKPIQHASVNATSFRVNETLVSRKVYSVLFDSPIENGYFNFGSSVSNIYYNFLTHVKKLPSGKYKANFYIPPVNDQTEISQIIRFYPLSTYENGTITNIQFFDGVISQLNYLPNGSDVVITNTNGTCIMYANGIMECYHQMFIEGTTTPAGDNGFVSETNTWTYPQPFTTDPIVTGSSTIIGRGFGLPSTPTRSAASFNTISSYTNSTGSNVFMRAIGKWK